jgi:hypothetical protein
MLKYVSRTDIVLSMLQVLSPLPSFISPERSHMPKEIRPIRALYLTASSGPLVPRSGLQQQVSLSVEQAREGRAKCPTRKRCTRSWLRNPEATSTSLGGSVDPQRVTSMSFGPKTSCPTTLEPVLTYTPHTTPTGGCTQKRTIDPLVSRNFKPLINNFEGISQL